MGTDGQIGVDYDIDSSVVVKDTGAYNSVILLLHMDRRLIFEREPFRDRRTGLRIFRRASWGARP